MNGNPVRRPRRLRVSEAVRSMVRETMLNPGDMVSPLFVVNGVGKREEVPSMPGVQRLSVDQALLEAAELCSLQIPAVILFGIPDHKDALGSAASHPDEAVQRTAAAIKKYYPELFVITDVCLCEYTDHGHCGLVSGDKILNDETLERLAEVALSHVQAGADMVAPSDMMDGRVAAIRKRLDAAGFQDRGIISYAVKYCSAFYGPFRDAAGSAPQFGCRRSYQMDPANLREALHEAKLDISEGADMLMVKPALAYLDVIRAVREKTDLPLVTYNVSGEYAMVKAAAARGWLDEERIVYELLLSMKRAGADLIITYHAKEAARSISRVYKGEETRMYDKSKALFTAARELIPGGVNSPVRAMKSIMHQPLFIERASGSRVFDADGNSYIDYVGSWGALLLGHAHPRIVRVIAERAAAGTSFGAPTRLETEMAALITEALPSMDMVRMVNSGTEAVMSALRLARGFTGRRLAIKFNGCYHGHCDSFLIRAGSGAAELGCPDSPGVTEGTAADTICLPFNDLRAVEKIFAARGEEVAAVVVEPVAGNMGLVLPKAGYLEGLREVTSRYGALLIFDEVITGFRVAYDGAQGRFGIEPDLTALGKIIGGGLPVGAYGGKREIMEQVAPAGSVYQAGTLAGNPLAMAAGIETLRLAGEPGFYPALEEKRSKLTVGLQEQAAAAGVEICAGGIGSLFGIFFRPGPVCDFTAAAAADGEAFKVFFRTLLKNGIYIAPSQFESGFISAAHSEEDIEATIEAAGKAFAAVKRFMKVRESKNKLIS